MTTPYDSTADTQAHIDRVRELLEGVVFNLDTRSVVHDASKLQEPEKGAFDRETPLLRDLTYGSDEYKAALSRLGDALKHHYAANSHHPEHNANGINGMSLLDLIEMLCDLTATTERHADGDLRKSLDINKERFGLSDQLHEILLWTAIELGFIAGAGQALAEDAV